MSDSWKVTVDCNRRDADAVVDFFDDSEEATPPTIVVSETANSAAPELSDAWRVEAYYSSKPTPTTLARLLAQIPSAKQAKPKPERIEQQDSVTLSQQGLEPVRGGRFHVHTPEMGPSNAPNYIDLEIGAGLAFGTGHHETTRGCLEMLDRLRCRGYRAQSMVDLGTGTGLLAIAALKLWPRVYATASDIDPVCHQVVAHNARTNGLDLGQKPGQLAMVIADGLDDDDLKRRAPYDLVVANILADPLIGLSDSICDVITGNGQLILAGLLNNQAVKVADAYRRCGFRLAESLRLGDWTILRMVARPASRRTRVW